MKLWVDTEKLGSAGRAVRATIQGQVEEINRQVLSRGVSAVNALRNAELEVLNGQRRGNINPQPTEPPLQGSRQPDEPGTYACTGTGR